MKAVWCSQNSQRAGIATSISFISVLGKLDRSTYLIMVTLGLQRMRTANGMATVGRHGTPTAANRWVADFVGGLVGRIPSGSRGRSVRSWCMTL